MEEVYDLHQHIHCANISIGNGEVHIQVLPGLNRRGDGFDYWSTKDACINYNKQKTKVLSWGRASFELRSHIRISNFKDGLYRISEKEKIDWNEDDIFFIKAVSDYINLMVTEFIEMMEPMESFATKVASLCRLHYIFIVPSDWREEIREELIRPIFIKANLISPEDHKDRLLFFSDVECLCSYLNHHIPNKRYLKKAQNTILCRIIPSGRNTALIKLDLISTMNPTFNFFDSSLYPKVVRSDSLLITSDEIKKSLKNKLLKHEQDSVGRWNTLKRLRNSVCMWMITKDIYYFGLPGIMDTSNDEDTPFNVDKKHETLIKATCTFDIHDIFGKDLLEKVKYIISNNFVKKYEFLILEDRPTSEARSRSILFPLKRRNTLAPPLVRWLMHLTKLNSLTLINKVTSFPYGVDVNSIMFGTERIAQEAIQNANIHCKPRMLLDEYSAQSLTLFSNSKPNAIFHIDILFAYTKLTLLILDGNGLVKEIFDHDYFVVDKCLPSLGSFFSITKFTALNVISL
ncbi:hypothetical protein BDF21DRAFT_31102 [Thamnidium elegans]|nr:hypothetical protein BDF21DRAFT_31102 [Thamnidium elegans]